ncbi:hypothetical protein Hanom_Chr09g00787191 [Helianthus anomalus]
MFELKAYLVNQDDERLPEGFTWDNYVLDKEFLKKSAFVAQILEEESVKSNPKRTPIFKELGCDADTDDEEGYINKARRGLETDSFNLFFAESWKQR